MSDWESCEANCDATRLASGRSKRRMPTDGGLCSPGALMDKQARKGQTRVNGQMESKFDADDVFAGAGGDGRHSPLQMAGG